MKRSKKILAAVIMAIGIAISVTSFWRIRDFYNNRKTSFCHDMGDVCENFYFVCTVMRDSRIPEFIAVATAQAYYDKELANGDPQVGKYIKEVVLPRCCSYAYSWVPLDEAKDRAVEACLKEVKSVM